MPRTRDATRSRARPDLASLVTRRHEALRDQLAAAHGGKVEGVHQARVASRRLREVVPILAHGLDECAVGGLRKDLRALTRALGPVRELDVAAGMIEELETGPADIGQLRARWLRQIDRRRHAPVRALHKALSPRFRDELDGELEAFAAARAASRDDSWREALARRLTDRAVDLRRQISWAGALYRPGPLHDVRIATKKLRYALEITAETGLVAVARPLRTLKSAQESLGHLHDLDVLFTMLHAVPATAPGEELHHAASTVIETLERHSRQSHAKYLRARASLTRLTELTLAVVAPRVQRPMRRAGETLDGD